MKIVLLLDSDDDESSFIESVILIEGIKLRILDSRQSSTEALVIIDSVEKFVKSDDEMLVVRFSGNEAISQVVGDELPELIITLSDKKESVYYIEHVDWMVLNIIDMFKREQRFKGD